MHLLVLSFSANKSEIFLKLFVINLNLGRSLSQEARGIPHFSEYLILFRTDSNFKVTYEFGKLKPPDGPGITIDHY